MFNRQVTLEEGYDYNELADSTYFKVFSCFQLIVSIFVILNYFIVSNKTEPGSVVLDSQRIASKVMWAVHMVPPGVDKWN